MSVFRITGRCIADPPPNDWRAQLSARLGARPRRMGIWAELGLYGALECMANAGEASLSASAGLILASRHGPNLAMRSLFEQAQHDLPMPLTLLQAQPSQALATFATHLKWCGDARFVVHTDPAGVLRLAGAQKSQDGFLVGWVEETGAGRSVWVRLIPCKEPANEYVLESAIFGSCLLNAHYLRA